MATAKPKLHTLVAACLAAVTNLSKAAGADYAAVAALILAAPLDDAEALKALQADIRTTFGESRKESANARINVLNNAKRIAFGGKDSDGHMVRGIGYKAMVEVVESVTRDADGNKVPGTFTALRAILAEKVPEALKTARGGDHKSKSKGGKVRIPKGMKRATALKAAAEILGFVANVAANEKNETLGKAVTACLAAIASAAASDPAKAKPTDAK